MIHPDHQAPDGVTVRIVTSVPADRTVDEVAQAAARSGMRLVYSIRHGLQQVPYLRPEHVEVGVAA